MTDNNRADKAGPDLLAEEIRALKAADPAPGLSAATKGAILKAAALNTTSKHLPFNLRVAVAAWADRFSGGLEVLLRPVAMGTFGVAGIAGLAAGSLIAAPAYAELTPEQELAAHYEFARLTGGEFYDDQDTDGIN